MNWIGVDEALPTTAKPVIVAYIDNGEAAWTSAIWCPTEQSAILPPSGWYRWAEHDDSVGSAYRKTYYRIRNVTHWAAIDLPTELVDGIASIRAKFTAKGG